MKLDAKNYDLLTSIVIGHLPESIEERKRVLVTLHATLPRDYIHRRELEAMIRALNDHARHQLEFAALLKGTTASGMTARKSGNGDGDGKKKGKS